MRIYIPKIQPPTDAERKALFILTRPFYKNGQWVNDSEVLARWGVSAAFQYTDQIDQADVFFIPHRPNLYREKNIEPEPARRQTDTELPANTLTISTIPIMCFVYVARVTFPFDCTKP